MYIRPKRTGAGLAFLGGLSVSVLVLVGGVVLYRTQATGWMEQVRENARLEAEQAYLDAHPMEPVYVFSRDMQAGDVLSETDLLLCEMPAGLLPADALEDPEQAKGLVVRGAVKASTVCSSSLLYGQEEYPDDARLQEFSSILLPSRLEPSACIDVRITFPNGLDYVVLAKKAVQSVESTEAGTGNRVWLTVNEEEILRISSAIVDAYLHPGTVLYALTYVAPDIQQAAICTYPANAYVQDLIRQNPNILSHAVTELDKANREWFDSIPNPVPNQPLAVVPAPEGLLVTASPGTGSQENPVNPSEKTVAEPSAHEGEIVAEAPVVAGAERNPETAVGSAGGPNPATTEGTGDDPAAAEGL
jgi:hypothetical protein